MRLDDVGVVEIENEPCLECQFHGERTLIPSASSASCFGKRCVLLKIAFAESAIFIAVVRRWLIVWPMALVEAA